MKKLLQIFTIIVIVIGFSGLCLSYVATIVYADDGYHGVTIMRGVDDYETNN